MSEAALPVGRREERAFITHLPSVHAQLPSIYKHSNASDPLEEESGGVTYWGEPELRSSWTACQGTSM